jgi:hypothetical protein
MLLQKKIYGKTFKISKSLQRRREKKPTARVAFINWMRSKGCVTTN